MSRRIPVLQWQNYQTFIINTWHVPIQRKKKKKGIGWRLQKLIIQATTSAPNCLCGRNTDSKKRIKYSWKAQFPYWKKINSLKSHSPATEVRRIVKQNPNLASDFIVIRATTMIVYIDFGLVVRSPPSLVVLLLVLYSADTTLFLALFSSRQLNNLNWSLRHGAHWYMMRKE